jgi:hypothetical protein
VSVPKPTRTPIAKQTMAMIMRMSFALTCCTGVPFTRLAEGWLRS